MAAATSTILIGTALAASTAYQMHEARKARKAGEKQVEQQDKKARQMETELKNRQFNERASEAQKIARARLQGGSSTGYSSGGVGSPITGTALGMSARGGLKTVLGA